MAHQYFPIFLDSIRAILYDIKNVYIKRCGIDVRATVRGADEGIDASRAVTL